jgi:prepilin-type N-terminal cleavage/methylation domain-containing protein
METQSKHSRNPGFTLLELMVTMTITTIIVTALVSITSISLDTWNSSRAELRASRQAKSFIDSLGRDLESAVIRSGNTHEWLSAITETEVVGEKLPSTSASKLIFFTSATDRYNGSVNVTGTDMGGDVSCVAYELDFRDPFTREGRGPFKTYVINRLLVNPNRTFTDLLGKPDLTSAFTSFAPRVSEPSNFICENVFQFAVTFNVEVTQGTGTSVTKLNVPVTVGPDSGSNTSQRFRIFGSGIETVAPSGVTAAELASGRVSSILISLSVLSDVAIDQLRTRSFNEQQKSDFLAKYSYQYTKLVQLPSL